MTARHVLIVHAQSGISPRITAALEQGGYCASQVNSLVPAMERVRRGDVCAVLASASLGGEGGEGFSEWLRHAPRGVALLCIADLDRLSVALSAVRAGADDFLMEPVDADELQASLELALANRAQARPDWDRRSPHHPLSRMIGTSPTMAAVFDTIRRVAALEVTILISGQTGTGKELAANALHQLSKRRAQPFITINCAAIPESLLESELFGHRKGAFTDANEGRTGLLTVAGAGTIFLDEIGDVGLGVQAKLLRTLEERRFRPLGAPTELPLDARVVVATHMDLEAQVAAGRFREDLYYRIDVIELALPSLRSRGRDVLLLAQHFAEQAATRVDRSVPRLSEAVASRLLSYPWPGNVRELQNAMTSAVARATNAEIRLSDLPRKISSYFEEPVSVEEGAAHFLTLAELEQRHIRRVLDAVKGNKVAAAQILGIDRKTLYRRLEAQASTTREARASGEHAFRGSTGGTPSSETGRLAPGRSGEYASQRASAAPSRADTHPPMASAPSGAPSEYPDSRQSVIASEAQVRSKARQRS